MHKKISVESLETPDKPKPKVTRRNSIGNVDVTKLNLKIQSSVGSDL
jgi:hypothetical protein